MVAAAEVEAVEELAPYQAAAEVAALLPMAGMSEEAKLHHTVQHCIVTLLLKVKLNFHRCSSVIAGHGLSPVTATKECG